jgi:hypothetical protein
MHLIFCGGFRDKKVPPVKPKRKSMCQNPGQEKKARVRYYDEMTQDQKEHNLESNSPDKNVTGEMNRNERKLSLKGEVNHLDGQCLVDLPKTISIIFLGPRDGK